MSAFVHPVKDVTPQPIRFDSLLTCPHCGFSRLETMPTNACIVFYECTHCHEHLRPKAGECCVFCSYGSVPCPPIQHERRCCRG